MVTEPNTPLSRWQKFRMVVKVVELRLRFIVLMAATGLIFGYWDTIKNHYEKWSRPAGSGQVAVSEFEYYCPMHPAVIQATPGGCPICGMPLSKRKKGEQTALPPGVTSRLVLSPMRVAQAGIQSVEIGYEPLESTVTAVGSVEFDERRMARISQKIKGMARVDKLFVDYTGMTVEAGQPLAEIYSPELFQAVQELLLSRRAGQTANRSSTGRTLLGDPEEVVRLGVERLKRWGLTTAQIDKILNDGKVEDRVSILSPISGHVIKKNVVTGQYVNEGESMFELADLSHVWILAKVPVDLIGEVRVGEKVEAVIEAEPGSVFPATVAFIQPHVDTLTRTVDVRFDLENADHKLRPGMFARVTMKTMVADRAEFQANTATLAPKDPRMRTVAEQKNCPVTKADLGSMGVPIALEVSGERVWICCEGCENQLKASPALYLAKLKTSGPPKHGVLAVPESAVIDTGIKKIVFVEVEPGVYEGRAVVLGSRSRDRYPVLQGLMAGDKVATNGSFLIDAETRLNATTIATPEPKAIAESPIIAPHVH